MKSRTAPAAKAAESSSQAAANLTQMLDNALPYHRAGWLRALLVYSRNAGGWAMQLPGGDIHQAGRSARRVRQIGEARRRGRAER